MRKKHKYECPKCRDANKTWELIAKEERERRRKALAGGDEEGTEQPPYWGDKNSLGGRG